MFILLLSPPGQAHRPSLDLEVSQSRSRCSFAWSARPAGLLPPSCYVLAAVTVLSSHRLSLSHSVSFDLGSNSIMRRGGGPPDPSWPSGSATVDITLNPPCLQMAGRQLNASTKASRRPAGSEHSVHAYSSTFPSIVVLNRTILCAHPRLVRAH
jgi:hypothetical protein